MVISLTRMGEDGSDRLMALCMVIYWAFETFSFELFVGLIVECSS